VDLWSGSLKANETRGHECSELVRLLPDNSDIYFAHDTWSDYRKLQAIVKDYHFAVLERPVKRVIITTVVSALASSHDWWLTDSGLLIFETTIKNYNLRCDHRKVQHTRWFCENSSAHQKSS
jgi:hypothetical protein